MSFILGGAGVITDPANAPIDVTANSAGPYLPGVAYTWNITNLDDYTTYTLTTTNGTIVRSSATLTYTPASSGAGGWTMNGRAINLTISSVSAFISTSTVSSTVQFTGANSANSSFNVGGWSANTALQTGTGIVAQYASTGVRQWIVSITDSFFYVFAAKLASDNSTFINLTDSTNTRGYVMKFNTSGSVTWSKYFSSVFLRPAMGVDASDNVVVGGALSGNFFVAKFNTSGTLQWQVTDAGVAGAVYGMTVDTSGNVFFVTGTSVDAYVGKLNSSGALQWVTRLSGLGSLYGNAIALDSSGNVLVSGEAFTSDTVGWVAKLNASGVLQWQRQILSCRFYGVATDSSDNVYVSGTHQPSGSPSGNNTIAKWNSSGVLQWQRSVAYGSTQTTQCTVSVVGSSFYLSNSGFTGAAWLLGQNRFPTDGSTPTFSIGSAPGTYSATAFTESAGSLTNPAGSMTISAAAATLTTSTPTVAPFTSTSQVKQGA